MRTMAWLYCRDEVKGYVTNVKIDGLLLQFSKCVFLYLRCPMKVIIMFCVWMCVMSSLYAQKDCSVARPDYIPLSDMEGLIFRGFPGGLYGNGSNIPPIDHAKAVESAVQSLQRLNANGLPDNNGKIVMIGVGASNPRTEFNEFMRNYASYPDKNSSLALINTCIGGQGIQKMNQQTDNYWKQAKKIIEDSNYSVNQVQIAWIETDNTQQADTVFPRAPLSLAKEYQQLLATLHKEFPQLTLCYLSARGYAGWVSDNQSVGKGLMFPRDYYNGWAIRFLLDSVMTNKGDYSYAGKDAVIPLATWGSYLWTNGEQPRKDGFSLDCETDIGPDGLHLTVAGERKMGSLLFNSFMANPSAKSWFTASKTTAIAEQNISAPFGLLINSHATTLFLSASESGEFPKRITLYSQCGEIIVSAPLSEPSMDISFLSNGIYYAVMQYNNQTQCQVLTIVR